MFTKTARVDAAARILQEGGTVGAEAVVAKFERALAAGALVVRPAVHVDHDLDRAQFASQAARPNADFV